MTRFDRNYWNDLATERELWRERALERAYTLLHMAERAQRRGAIWRAGTLFTCWRRCIALANAHRDSAAGARKLAQQHDGRLMERAS